jgi:hypothetical protein
MTRAIDEAGYAFKKFIKATPITFTHVIPDRRVSQICEISQKNRF